MNIDNITSREKDTKIGYELLRDLEIQNIDDYVDLHTSATKIEEFTNYTTANNIKNLDIEEIFKTGLVIIIFIISISVFINILKNRSR